MKKMHADDLSFDELKRLSKNLIIKYEKNSKRNNKILMFAGIIILAVVAITICLKVLAKKENDELEDDFDCDDFDESYYNDSDFEDENSYAEEY